MSYVRVHHDDGRLDIGAVSAGERTLERRVATGVLARVFAVRVRNGLERVAPGAPGSGRAERGRQLTRTAGADAPPQVLEPVDVRIQRGRSNSETLREGRERHGLEAVSIGQLGRSRHDRLDVQPGARHQARAALSIACSIASPGHCVAGPCPTTRIFGDVVRDRCGVHWLSLVSGYGT